MIERGEVLCLIGASGSGKSTLLQRSNGQAPIRGGQQQRLAMRALWR